MQNEALISHFTQLKKRLTDLENPNRISAIARAKLENQWFSPESVEYAINSIAEMITESALKQWVSEYDIKNNTPKNIGVVMAGNIPLVGFHDALCVIASGNKLSAKLSSQDRVLMQWVFNELKEINSIYEFLVEEVDKVKNVDAVIATGSDNTARYFEYYFKDIPHVIRKNRTSVAVLDGNESEEDLKLLAKDIFLYYGLGCRNVSKIFIPEGYSFDSLYEAFKDFSGYLDFHKYSNNYEYNKAIYLMKQSDILDLEVILLEKSDQLVSPIAVNYIEEYNTIEEVQRKLENEKEKIQCVVGKKEFGGNIDFGKTQIPGLWDYADNIDTMKFLTGLND